MNYLLLIIGAILGWLTGILIIIAYHWLKGKILTIENKQEKTVRTICKKCIYYHKGCFYDAGDSLTKIPCRALTLIIKINNIIEKDN